MSVYLRPCTGCPIREGCEQRDVFRKAVAGIGLRSATFNCERLEKAIAPGTRISVNHPIMVDVGGSSYDGPQYEIQRAELPATITSSKRGEFSCVIDRDALITAIDDHGGEGTEKVDTYRFRKMMPARRVVRFLDEPRRELCSCGNPKLSDGKCDQRQGQVCLFVENAA